MLGFAAEAVEQPAQAQGREGHGLPGGGSAGVQSQIEGRDGGGGDDQSLNAHTIKEGLGQDALVPGPGLFRHDLVGVRLQTKGDGGQRVRQQVDEQQVHCREGHGQSHQRGVEHR